MSDNGDDAGVELPPRPDEIRPRLRAEEEVFREMIDERGYEFESGTAYENLYREFKRQNDREMIEAYNAVISSAQDLFASIEFYEMRDNN